ncbi:MAG: hypothetical protein LBF83_06160 [Spirochaetaceae bacterium]|nr:hypothetical protein [Spirochaetaceae bacterium]
MRYFIEKNGGKVVHTGVLALGKHGDRLASPPRLQHQLVDKFGAVNLKSFCKEYNLYEGNYKCFTEAEGRLIERSQTLDRAGDRIAAARLKGLSRDGKDITEGRETPLSRSPREYGIER